MPRRQGPFHEQSYVRAVRLRRGDIAEPGRYPFTIPALRSLDSLELHPRVTFLVGENGSGKSTLIEAIAIAAGLNAEGGSKQLRFAHRPTESDLHRHLTLVRGTRRERTGFFLRAETLFNVFTEMENVGSVPDSPHLKSHGEAFVWLVSRRFHPGGFYVLDEPESALSPQRQLVLLRHIHLLAAAGAQFVIATHSPVIMAYPHALIYLLAPEGPRVVRYEETEHYLVTRAFLECPETMFKHLLVDESGAGDDGTPQPDPPQP